jgi:hypothetical protein
MYNVANECTVNNNEQLQNMVVYQQKKVNHKYVRMHNLMHFHHIRSIKRRNCANQIHLLYIYRNYQFINIKKQIKNPFAGTPIFLTILYCYTT